MIFTLKAALRDLRFDAAKLALAVSAISAGVAAITAVTGFGDSILATIDRESRDLLGADYILSSRKPFTGEALSLIDSLPGQKARITSMATMMYVPKADESRLVQLRAIEGDFPLYGTFSTTPETAASYQETRSAVVDESLQLLYGLAPGDSIKIGYVYFPVAGIINAAAGEAAASTFSGPRVLIPLSSLPETGLMSRGSLVNHEIGLASPTFDFQQFDEANETRLEEMGLRTETVADRQRSLGRATENLTRFLSMIGLFTLLIGGAGVAGAIHAYIKRKHKTVAVMRCIGMSPGQAVSVYLTQTVLFAAGASFAGLFIGIALLYAIPQLLAGILPFDVVVSISWKTILLGTSTGLVISLLFSWTSLAGLRGVSPLSAIRADVQVQPLPRWVWALISGSGILIFWGIASVLANSLRNGALFTAGAATVLLFFSGFATLLVYLIRKSTPANLPFSVRNALSGLFRPNNQTTAIITVVGFSVFLITIIAATQFSLLREVQTTGSGGRPNMMLIDIQPDQREAVEKVLQEVEVFPSVVVPVVTMRLASLEGIPADSVAKKNPKIPNWTINREYRSSYRNFIGSTETVTAGNWPPESTSGPVAISIEADLARQMQLEIGDRLDFDVQGIVIQCSVGAIREVDWQSLQPNFFIIFPEGVLEAAPQFLIAAARMPDIKIASQVKRNLALQVPNVTVIDLDLIVRTVEGLLDQIAWVLRFMSMFTLITGLIVFSASMYATRGARERESAVLRTLGAAYRVIRNTSLTEFAFLGSIASILGMLIALVASSIVMELVFEARLAVNIAQLLLIPAGAVTVLVLLGWFMNRRILSSSPMMLLRTE